jgi:hypothetical protein
MLTEFKFEKEDYDKIIELEMMRETVENSILNHRANMSIKYGYIHNHETKPSPKGSPYFMAEPRED